VGGPDGKKTEFMRQLYFKRLHSTTQDEKTDKALVRLILDQAKLVIAHPARPTKRVIESFNVRPFSDLAIEETLEENPVIQDPEHLLVEHTEEKPFSCVVILDTSSSMSGEKHLLASIAVAVLVLKVPSVDHSLVVFSSEAKTIKKFGVQEKPENTILRFLKSQPRGFTNLSLGLKEGMKQLQSLTRNKRKIGMIATDGRTTEGGDPLEFARQFDFLLVLHLSGAGSDKEASNQLAQAGK
jgi:Mg-chelatase subunit ChlD